MNYTRVCLFLGVTLAACGGDGGGDGPPAGDTGVAVGGGSGGGGSAAGGSSGGGSSGGGTSSGGSGGTTGGSAGGSTGGSTGGVATGGGGGGPTGGGGVIEPSCNETCASSGDGECDDGGPGAAFAVCPLGSDCGDCGPRDGAGGGGGTGGGGGGAGGQGGAGGEPGPCEGVECPVPAPRCEGNVSIFVGGEGTCNVLTGRCEYPPELTDPCDLFGFACVEGSCVDLCADAPPCPPPEPSCDGRDRMRYAGPGFCGPETGECDYSRVAVREPCADGLLCDDGRCVEPCGGRACAPNPPHCEGAVAVAELGDGVCSEVTGRCDYAAVTTRDDCGARGQVCEGGACVPDDIIAPRPGDLVVTEMMLDTLPGEPQWLELYNTSPRRLDTDGLTVMGPDAGALGPDQPPFIAPQSYLVVGLGLWAPWLQPGPPGMVSAADFSLPVRRGTVTVAFNGVTIDELRFDAIASAGRNGASLQLDRDFDVGDDTNLWGAWCASVTAYDGRQQGTPGEPNESCDARVSVVPIAALHDVNHPDHPRLGERLGVRNVVVTGTDGRARLWVQELGAGPGDGVMAYNPQYDYSQVHPGDRVDIDGVINFYRGLDEIVATRIEVTGAGDEPEPLVVPAATLLDPVQAEPYEGLLVRVERVAVTDENPDAPQDFNEFAVGDGLRVDDIMYAVSRPLPIGTTFRSLTGVLTFTFGHHKLLPRGPGDLDDRRPPGPMPTDLEIRFFDVSPNPATVPIGTPARWTNNDRAAHTITSGRPGDLDAGSRFDSGPLRTGETFEAIMRWPGPQPYHCRSHPDEGVAWQLDVQATCEQACDALVDCLDQRIGAEDYCIGAQAWLGNDPMVAGACRAHCVEGEALPLTCEPPDPTTEALCASPMCFRLVDARFFGTCVAFDSGVGDERYQLCERIRPEFWTCLGEATAGSLDANALCAAGPGCEALLF